MADDKKPFKISQLPLIKNIDDDDLLIVSDKDGGKGGKKYYTRSMTIQQLAQAVIDRIAQSSAIMDQLKLQAAATAEVVAADTAETVATQIAGDITAERVEQIIQENPNITLDLLDGHPDGQLIMGDDE